MKKCHPLRDNNGNYGMYYKFMHFFLKETC